MSIAAYILELWDRDEKADADNADKDTDAARPTFAYKFADLGCGNGLLTYLLTAEGYRGYGVDLRRRKIWDMYSPRPDLREEAIMPNTRLTLPE